MSAKELCLHVSASQGNYSVNGVAILTRVFTKKVYGGVCQAAKKSSRNDEVAVRPVRRGFTLADR